MRGSLLRDGSIFHGGGMSRLGLVITHAQSRCDDAFKRTYTRTRVRPQARQGGKGEWEEEARLAAHCLTSASWPSRGHRSRASWTSPRYKSSSARSALANLSFASEPLNLSAEKKTVRNGTRTPLWDILLCYPLLTIVSEGKLLIGD